MGLGPGLRAHHAALAQESDPLLRVDAHARHDVLHVRLDLGDCEMAVGARDGGVVGGSPVRFCWHNRMLRGGPLQARSNTQGGGKVGCACVRAPRACVRACVRAPSDPKSRAV